MSQIKRKFKIIKFQNLGRGNGVSLLSSPPLPSPLQRLCRHPLSGSIKTGFHKILIRTEQVILTLVRNFLINVPLRNLFLKNSVLHCYFILSGNVILIFTVRNLFKNICFQKNYVTISQRVQLQQHLLKFAFKHISLSCDLFL